MPARIVTPAAMSAPISTTQNSAGAFPLLPARGAAPSRAIAIQIKAVEKVENTNAVNIVTSTAGGDVDQADGHVSA